MKKILSITALMILVIASLNSRAFAGEKKKVQTPQEKLVVEVFSKLARSENVKMNLPNKCTLVVETIVMDKDKKPEKTVQFAIPLKNVSIEIDPNFNGIVKLSHACNEQNNDKIHQFPIKKSVNNVLTDSTCSYMMTFHAVEMDLVKKKFEEIVKICDQN